MRLVRPTLASFLVTLVACSTRLEVPSAVSPDESPALPSASRFGVEGPSSVDVAPGAAGVTPLPDLESDECRFASDGRSIDADTCSSGNGCPAAPVDGALTTACVPMGVGCAYADLDRWLPDLGSPEFAERDAASRALVACCASTGYLAMLDAFSSQTTSPEQAARLRRAVATCGFRLRPCGATLVRRLAATCPYWVETFTAQVTSATCEGDSRLVLNVEVRGSGQRTAPYAQPVALIGGTGTLLEPVECPVELPRSSQPAHETNLAVVLSENERNVCSWAAADRVAFAAARVKDELDAIAAMQGPRSTYLRLYELPGCVQ